MALYVFCAKHQILQDFCSRRLFQLQLGEMSIGADKKKWDCSELMLLQTMWDPCGMSCITGVSWVSKCQKDGFLVGLCLTVYSLHHGFTTIYHVQHARSCRFMSLKLLQEGGLWMYQMVYISPTQGRYHSLRLNLTRLLYLQCNINRCSRRCVHGDGGTVP